MNHHYFILTEAAAMIPLLGPILVDIRQARARRARRQRQVAQAAKGSPPSWVAWADHEEAELRQLEAEAERLGVTLSPGIRCEAWIPFQHQWIGPEGDQKLRRAFFVYSDALPTIREWFFAGWPEDRRPIWPAWWQQHREPPTGRSARSTSATRTER